MSQTPGADDAEGSARPSQSYYRLLADNLIVRNIVPHLSQEDWRSWTLACRSAGPQLRAEVNYLSRHRPSATLFAWPHCQNYRKNETVQGMLPCNDLSCEMLPTDTIDDDLRNGLRRMATRFGFYCSVNLDCPLELGMPSDTFPVKAACGLDLFINELRLRDVPDTLLAAERLQWQMMTESLDDRSSDVRWLVISTPSKPTVDRWATTKDDPRKSHSTQVNDAAASVSASNRQCPTDVYHSWGMPKLRSVVLLNRLTDLDGAPINSDALPDVGRLVDLKYSMGTSRLFVAFDERFGSTVSQKVLNDLERQARSKIDSTDWTANCVNPRHTHAEHKAGNKNVKRVMNETLFFMPLCETGTLMQYIADGRESTEIRPYPTRRRHWLGDCLRTLGVHDSLS